MPGRPETLLPPLVSPVDGLLSELHAALEPDDSGQVATYIPELARADPSALGIAVATLDATTYGHGDDQVEFTIQSVSKPFVYALALADRGLAEVLAAVGTEPTGDAFNSITLEPGTGRPFNPMVNAGAIVTSTLVAGGTAAQRSERIVRGLSAFAGRELSVDAAVLASEQATGDRNRAIAHLMRGAGALAVDVGPALDSYFLQCSILVTCRDLAVMGATLANGGRNPVTGVQVVERELVGPVLTVMTTCGMYDYAGEWLFHVGLPAKSGVSGAVVAVLPGQLGIGAWSPRLDERGNSVRAVAACRGLSDRLGLHLLGEQRTPAPVVRRQYRGDVVHSKRVRTVAARAILDRDGGRLAVKELQGDLTFVAAESLVRAVLGDLEGVRWLVLDLRRVGYVSAAAVELLDRLCDQLAADGVELVWSRASALPPAIRLKGATDMLALEAALERCEDALLTDAGAAPDLPDATVPLAEQDLLAGLDPAGVELVASLTSTTVLTPGMVVFEPGQAPDAIYFVSAGLVTILVKAGRDRHWVRLNTVGAGSAFGELAVIDGGPRSSRVVAEEPTLCHVLPLDAVDRISREHPHVAAVLHRNIARNLSGWLRHATQEIQALES